MVSPTAGVTESAVSPSADLTAKHYTVGGIVQSAQKPFHPLDDARIEATGTDRVTTVSDVNGAFALAVQAGFVTLTVTRAGYEPWSATIPLFGHETDLRPLLEPLP